MYVPVPPQQPSNARAWLAAVNAIKDQGGEAHNVIVDIADPLTVNGPDAEILTAVDKFLRNHNSYSLSTVANTIFPQGLLDQHGPEKFYEVYEKKVLPRVKKMTRDWGRYFERLTIWKKVKGSKIEVINPLADLVGFMKSQIESGHTYRNVYEMTIYDPARDAGKVVGRQCLSFLSFKLSADHTLSLTAVYRNHYYVARTLGNFIGLGNLMAFAAAQSGAKVGSLTCVSTHAVIDADKKTEGGVKQGWTKTEAKLLIESCSKFLET
jgi:thymidylate synthase